MSRSLRPAPHRAVPRPPAPASEPQPHETRYYFVAPSPRRSAPFSTSRHCYPSDCELSSDTTGGSQIKMSSAAAPTNSRPPAPICPQRRRPTPLPPKPLPNQIPIDREPLTSPRGFLLRRLSDAGPRHGCTGRRPAGSRNPSRERPLTRRPLELRRPMLCGPRVGLRSALLQDTQRR